MLFQNGPADTLDFMLMGYAVILVFIGGYVGSLIVRARQLKRDKHVLEEVVEQEDLD
ncbi:MAG: hypothetical protein ACLFWD_00095 [Anaerolineales bacterium]